MGGGIETTTGSVAGRLVYPDGSPLSRARVLLTDSLRTLRRETVADSQGLFRLDSLPLGRWRLRATAVRWDTFMVQRSLDLLPAHADLRLDSLIAELVVHVRLRAVSSTGATLPGTRFFLADSSCFSPFDPWSQGEGICRTRGGWSDSLGVLEMDDLPASTWYLLAVAPEGVAGRMVFRTLHGGGIWQLGDLRLQAPKAVWHVSSERVSTPFAFVQFGNGATPSRNEQQRTMSDDSGRIWLDSGLDLYRQPWVAFRGDSLLAEGFVADSATRDLRIELGSSEKRWIDLSTGGSLVSATGEPIEIVSVSRTSHATPPTIPDGSGGAVVGPYRIGGPWDLRIDYLCRSKIHPDSTWMQVWTGYLQEPRLEPGTWAAETCVQP
jgi:hypothetical protein